MNQETDQQETTAEMQAEVLLQRLMQLKQYERPEPARMTRNKQNIMREVRAAQTNKRKSLGDLIEVNMPWFFSEPKYGIAAVFVAFVALQYVGVTSRTSSQSTGIYTSNTDMASLQQAVPHTYASTPKVAALKVRNTGAATNGVSYPNLPSNYPLFQDNQRSSDVMFVERLEPVRY